MRPDLTVLSLGAGVQSSTLYLMACAGEFDVVPDYAIFADTQSEPPWVYEQLEYLKTNGSIPILTPSAGSLEEACLNRRGASGERWASIPFWISLPSANREGTLRRQCTRDYKIDVIKAEIRRLLGLEKGQVAAGRYRVQEWLGISLDEAHRMKPSRYSWIESRWPLIEERMRRWDCLKWLREHGHAEPKRSACYFCPFHNDRFWASLRESDPDLFEKACSFDDALRDGNLRSVEGTAYLHRSLTPLREVEFKTDDPNQVDLFGNECEGMCGV